MFDKLLSPSPSVKLFLGLALDADEDDPQRSALWRWVYKQAHRVVDMYHAKGRTLVDVKDILEHWVYSVEDSRMLGDPFIDDLHCGFKTISQECQDNGFECVSYQDFEKFSEEAWADRPAFNPNEAISNHREVNIIQQSADIAGRPERPFLNGMYENTLPEPWGGYDYSGIPRLQKA